jgi:glycosyltransferase involved in cell wall biosynthesis
MAEVTMSEEVITAARKKVMIGCSHFWPSVGGLETSMAQLGAELIAMGYEVTVITMAFPSRQTDHHRGIRIISVELADLPDTIRAAVGSGEYGACLLIQDPMGTVIRSVDLLERPAHTRLLVQPIINDDGYSQWKDMPEFRRRLVRVLKMADAAMTMTRSGIDHRYMLSEGVTPVYLPNATSPMVSGGDFRSAYGIGPDQFMILHVANVVRVKNHVGLIDALPNMPPNWKLVMVGTPVNREYVAALQAKLAERPEVLYIPGLVPEWVAAAMQAADVMVLASHGEGSPITLLEGMSHGKPWLATPQCGAANDHLGGVICDLPDFMPRLRQLATDPALRKELGEISLAHWQQCYSWPVVLQGWLDLIEAGHLRRSFEPAAALVEQMRHLRERMASALPRVALLVERASAEAALAPALGLALTGRYSFHVVYRDCQEQPDAGAAEADVLVDLCMGATETTRRSAARYLTRAMLADGLRTVDYDVYGVDVYRDGALRVGWIGDAPKRANEVHQLVVPAMGEHHSMSILDEYASPQERAVFLQAIDVLLLTNDDDYSATALADAMAGAVFTLGIRHGRLSRWLVYQPAGLLAEPSGEALHAALNWCEANLGELRRRSYRQAQRMALHAPEVLLPGEWERVLGQALG